MSPWAQANLMLLFFSNAEDVDQNFQLQYFSFYLQIQDSERRFHQQGLDQVFAFTKVGSISEAHLCNSTLCSEQNPPMQNKLLRYVCSYVPLGPRPAGQVHLAPLMLIDSLHIDKSIAYESHCSRTWSVTCIQTSSVWTVLKTCTIAQHSLCMIYNFFLAWTVFYWSMLLPCAKAICSTKISAKRIV